MKPSIVTISRKTACGTAHFPDVERSRLAYEAVDNGRVEVLQGQFNEHFLRPSDSDINDSAVHDFARSGKMWVIVPMREKGPVIRPLLTILVRSVGMDPARILIVDDGSDDEALAEVRRFQTRLIHRNQVLDCVDWGKLLPVLNLAERPKGKGIAVLVGYLLQFFLAQKMGAHPEWLVHNDAEIKGYASYRGVEYLSWAVLQEPSARYVKMAKSGRGNERCMAARNMMDVIAESSFVNEAIRQRARQLFNRLTKHKWLITGEFALRFDLAMERPLASGYLEETLCSMYCEDVFARQQQGCTVQVANPHMRDDGENDERKESIMQQQISNFLLMMALEADPADAWDLPEIARLNATCLARPLRLGWIPGSGDPVQNCEPVKAELIKNDRIIPSVKMLVEGGFVNTEALRRLI